MSFICQCVSVLWLIGSPCFLEPRSCAQMQSSVSEAKTVTASNNSKFLNLHVGLYLKQSFRLFSLIYPASNCTEPIHPLGSFTLQFLSYHLEQCKFHASFFLLCVIITISDVHNSLINLNRCCFQHLKRQLWRQ